MKGQNAQGQALSAVLGGLLLLQGAAGFQPGATAWGLNHLAYLPLWVRIGWPLLGLLLLWPRAAQALGAWLVRRVEPLLLGPGWVAYGLLPAMGAGAFWLLRTPTHFLGDGLLLAQTVQIGVPFHGFDLLAYHLHALLGRLFETRLLEEALDVFAWMSIFSGALYLVAVAWSVRRLAREPGEGVLLYGLLVLAAPLQMFMGYAECYALLMVALLLFAVTLVLYYRGRFPLAGCAGFFAAGLALHLNALFLAPLLIAPLLRPAPEKGAPAASRAGVGRRLAAVGLPPVAALVLAAGIMALSGYDLEVFQHDFFTSRAGQRLLVPLTGRGGLLDPLHWKDVANLVLLLAPVPTALILTRLIARPANPAPALPARILLWGCGWLLVIAVLLQMTLGMARDWDLLAAATPIAPLAAALLWRRPRARWIGSTLVAACFLTLPWFWLNAGEARSLTRFRDVMADQRAYARAYAHEEIGKHYRERGEIERAIEQYRICTRIAPGRARFHGLLGEMHLRLRDPEAALAHFQRQLAIDSTRVDALEEVARIQLGLGRAQEALATARRYAGRPEETADGAEVHGRAAEAVGALEEAIGAFQRALQRDARRLHLREQIGHIAIERGDFAVAEQIFRAVLRDRPGSWSARAGLAAAIYAPLRGVPEDARLPEAVRARLAEAQHLLGTVLRQGRGDTRMQEWYEEIRVRLGRD